MNKYINTSLAQYQIQQLNKQAIVSHARPFDLSIAQLENWPIRPIRTRRNGSRGLRRDIKRCVQGSISIAQNLRKACGPLFNTLFKLAQKANSRLDRFQLSHADLPQPEHSKTEYLQSGHLQSEHLCSQTHMNTSPQQDLLADTQFIQTAKATRTVSIKPMQQIVQPNLLKDGLATAVWIVIAPTVMILGTMAGY